MTPVAGAIDQAITGAGVRMAFQPIVHLPDEVCVGYEALARWPSIPTWSPAAVFAQAADAGVLDRLDAVCVDRAATSALDAGSSSPGMLLAINSEPTVPHVGGADGAALARAASHFSVIFELTERGLLTNPRATLRKVAQLRARGFAIALDDVGAHPDSLALLDIVGPEIIKLDLGLIQGQPDRMQARTVAAVLAHQERTGASILAEGIETDQHLEQALAYGACLGQGHRFGVPGELGSCPASWTPPAVAADVDATGVPSVFELTARGLPIKTVRKEILLALSRQIERLAAAADSPPIILTTMQDVRYFTRATRSVYRALAETSPLVAIFGVDVMAELDAGIRGVDLRRSDPLCDEWTIVVLGPDSSAALVARECATIPGGADGDRRFQMTITFDRSRVALAARKLLDRI
jgi:EAL domain-containing protein (putative c-di-GMP-specific phosphodiesterase class I)